MKLFTIWFNPVKPNQAHRFLVHLLRSCGCFIDECDLFGSGSLRQSFVKERLLNEDRIEESIKKLMKMRFVNQLKHLPSGTPTFDHHCAAAFSTIAAFCRDDAMHTDETPCDLCNRLKRNTDRRVKTHMESQASIFVQHALNKLHTSLASTDCQQFGDLNNATLEAPHIWDVPDLERPVG